MQRILWKLVVIEVVELDIAKEIAEERVECKVGRDTQTASELMQNALSKIENWCYRVGLTVNPNKSELLLFTNKRKYSLPLIRLFKTCIPIHSNVKYLGVCKSNKLLTFFNFVCYLPYWGTTGDQSVLIRSKNDYLFKKD